MKKDRKLLLIAMSGVRVKDQELLEFGMTLPGFIERSKVIASLPSLSLLTIAAYTPDNWEVEYREIDQIDFDDIPSIIDQDFDLIGISAFTARIFDAYKLSDFLREHGQTVVLGGLHVSILPEEAQHHADSIVIGEGEAVWETLLQDYENDSLQKSYSSKNVKPRFHFRNSIIPRYDLLDVRKYNRITLQTTRGCPLDCSFCAASRLISKYKIKPIDSIRQELETIIDLWPKPFIELADDNTFYDKSWGHELAKLFSEYKIKWFTETDISISEDDQLLELLAKSGCAQVLIGLESSVPNSLRGIDAKEWKYNQYESYLQKIEKIQSYGISVNGCFILGFDSDEKSIFKTTADFVSASSLAEVQVTILTPFPGTKLYRDLYDGDRLFEEVFWDKCTLFDLTFDPERMSVDELNTGFKWLMKTLYSDEEYRKRKNKFNECVRTAGKVKHNQSV